MLAPIYETNVQGASIITMVSGSMYTSIQATCEELEG